MPEAAAVTALTEKGNRKSQKPTQRKKKKITKGKWNQLARAHSTRLVAGRKPIVLTHALTFYRFPVRIANHRTLGVVD